MTDNAHTTGIVTRVSGPIVDARNMADAQAYEVVHVGPRKLIGEVIKLSGDIATIQVYEYTGGLKPGDEVHGTGGPLSVELAPGLLGTIFDGIQRPLNLLAEKFGAFLEAGQEVPVLDEERRWHFTPTVSQGDELAPGDIFGTVSETESVDHKLMVPPGAKGTVARISEEGDYAIREVLCELEQEFTTHELTMVQRWPVRRGRPFAARHACSGVLVTGQRVIDSLFPVARGGAAAIPGDFGTGKTILQHQLAKWSDADVVVYVGCGERGNEMTDILRTFPELQDPRSGRSLMERTVLIGNTSNMPVAAREVSIYTGITIAEYYRDMGYNVAVMADSTSRWAEALREASSRLEEMPAEEGYPAYLAARLAEFYERAGHVDTLGGRDASLTVVGAVSPPGGDFSEPVTQHTTRFTRCFWALDQELAYSRHYPAINWLESYSQYVEDTADWWRRLNRDWPTLREEIMNLMVEEDKLQQIVRLVGPDVLPDGQRLVLLVAEMFKVGFLQQSAMDKVDTYCSPEKQQRLLEMFVTFYRRCKRAITAGATMSRIREMDVIPALQRAKFTIPNDDSDALEALWQKLEAQLAQLEKEYAQ